MSTTKLTAPARTDGTGKVRKLFPETSRFTGVGPTSLTAGDLDGGGDGKPDMVVASLGALSFLRNITP